MVTLCSPHRVGGAKKTNSCEEITVTHIDPNDAPAARITEWYKCDSCGNLHLILLDEHDKIIATAVISKRMLIDMLKAIDE